MNKNTADIKIRSVIKSDLGELFNMLVDLVKHEGLIERFKLTPERFQTELFGEHADWHCLVACSSENKPVGFCLYTYANINRAFNVSPMIQVDDLYVSPKYRQLNIGQKLIRALAEVAQKNNIGRLNIWCVKDNLVGQNFYQKIGAEKREFIDVFSIQVSKLLSNPVV